MRRGYRSAHGAAGIRAPMNCELAGQLLDHPKNPLKLLFGREVRRTAARWAGTL
jgi:hypothetical protein